jgi:hypothetical protein
MHTGSSCDRFRPVLPPCNSRNARSSSIYGGKRVTIRKNFFHHNDVPAHIGGWDGNDHNVVEDNVFVGSSGNGVAIAMSSDNGSVIRHNTLVQGQCN